MIESNVKSVGISFCLSGSCAYNIGGSLKLEIEFGLSHSLQMRTVSQYSDMTEVENLFLFLGGFVAFAGNQPGVIQKYRP